MSAPPPGLFEAARAVRERAYAPYSNFKVGAALLAEDGHIYAAANVENAAYPQSQCAEASAIGLMIAGGARRIRAVALVGEGVCTPCGGCRQRLREFASDATPIHLCGLEGPQRTVTLGELLPLAFGPRNLGF